MLIYEHGVGRMRRRCHTTTSKIRAHRSGKMRVCPLKRIPTFRRRANATEWKILNRLRTIFICAGYWAPGSLEGYEMDEMVIWFNLVGEHRVQGGNAKGRKEMRHDVTPNGTTVGARRQTVAPHVSWTVNSKANIRVKERQPALQGAKFIQYHLGV